ncbi:uncharacterized protein LOC124937696 isoform X2 [Impatiens glandulifera]|uniref:uncharacterized protein LOC124937696 isoform X2 n=1 Tax=Impatiens glandulifera TaxID=253017 RepID=UPI001FB0A762|nr:uncharacterized protein LOC124937696 isoform X2 [Impatiens glandulifera]
MSMKDEIGYSPVEAAESSQEPNKQSKIAYTRDFLLSLSELDVCKELPSGFDPSKLSEFGDINYGLFQDKQRNHGNFPLQSLQRNEYGSSPPARGDSNNYTKGIYGKRDNHSGSWNDKDTHLQSERDSDTGRRYGNLSRKSWQTSEHDGLLGSGSFSRPSSGHTAGLSDSKVPPNDHYQLNRSTEPYHPPRPYKAVPHVRRETKDSRNDETFGSSESAGEDKMEEERRRRASFELMRKEQHKSLQEKQNQNAEKRKDGQVSDISEFLDDTSRDLRPFGRREVDETVIPPASTDSSKSSLLPQISRPRVPPGFKNTVPEKDSCTSLEVGISKVEESFSHGETIGKNGILDNREVRPNTNKTFGNKQAEKASAGIPLFNDDKLTFLSSADTILSSIVDASETTMKMEDHNASNGMKQHNTSILGKMVDSVLLLNVNGSSDANELPVGEHYDVKGSDAVQSSKFAHWFLEDEKKTSDTSFGRANNLLSLIGISDNHASQVTDVEATKQNMKEFSFMASETMTGDGSSSIGLSEQSYSLSNQGNAPKVLTCEDLEQTILSEYGESSLTQNTNLQSWSPLASSTQPTKADIDSRASQHLLNLLQNGKDIQDVEQSCRLFNGKHVSEHANGGNIKVDVAENNSFPGKSLTLETLFGSAFMKELQSVDAPVSTQRGSVGSRRIDENDALGLNQNQQTKLDRTGKWVVGDTQIDVGPSKQLDGYNDLVDVQLPEGDLVPNSLFSFSGKPITKRDSQPMNITVSTGLEGSSFVRGPYNLVEPEIPYHNFQSQTSSPPVYSHINQARSFPNPHDVQARQFNGSMHHLLPSHHSTARPRGGYDLPIHPMLQQMQMSANVPPSHMVREIQRGPPLLPPLQELNAMQGVPFLHRPPNFAGHGMPMMSADGNIGNNYPEAIQRLIEMEVRANAAKQRAHHNSQGMFGHDQLDVGFRYR